MVKFENVTVIYEKDHFGKIHALSNVSFEVKENEFVLLVGKSGSGKTTILRVILGEVKPTEGRVFFDGKEITKLPPGEISKIRRQIGVIFQDYKLLSFKNAMENLMYVLEITNTPEKEIERESLEALEIVGLKNRAKNFPHELSAGEKQRLAIARSLLLKPKLILADEPTGNLDPYNTYEILEIFKKIHQMGKTIILATHNEEVVKYLKKRVLTLEDGEIIRDDEKGRFLI
jgi:cell division transport system ATP-binding protein